jgi:polyisoprenoid-binding protein YceI
MTRSTPTNTDQPRSPIGVSPAADVERWEIDPARSSLTFTLRHLVVSEIMGTFRRWGGTLFLDRREPILSSVNVWIDTATIDTDSVERDDHMRSSEFLDVKTFPRAEFASSSIEERRGHAVIHGRLTLHGVTHDLTIELEPYLAPEGPDNLYRMRGKLDRQAFGLRWNQDLDVGGVVVGDEIRVAAELALVRVNGQRAGRP